MPKPEEYRIRPALVKDAPALAELINIAGEGLPLRLWENLRAGNETVWDVGRRRAMRDTGGFSYLNATILESGNKTAGLLIGYSVPDQPEAIDYDNSPPMLIPLMELEQLAPAAWYLNVLAVYRHFRGNGYGDTMLEHAVELTSKAGKSKISLIVSDGNPVAIKLYEKHGFRAIDQRPMAKGTLDTRGDNWSLMVKTISNDI